MIANISDAPYMVRHASDHRGSYPKRFVDAAEIVVHIVQGN
jgi:hypothetical protein